MTAVAARGFPAFGVQRGTPPVRSRWARAWLAGLEEMSLDPGPWRAGGRVARAGLVGPIAVAPGSVSAAVTDGEESCRAVIRVPELTAAQWGLVRAEAVDRAGYVAALAEGELPAGLVSAAAGAGVDLLPGLGDLEPDCGCESWEHPCVHAAALGRQAGWLIDADPLLLLLLRGRDVAALLTPDVRLPDGVGPDAAEPVPARPPAAEPVPARPPAVPRPFPAVPRLVPGAAPDVATLPVASLPPVPLGDADPDLLVRLALAAARRAGALLAGDLPGDAPDDAPDDQDPPDPFDDPRES